ncbi:MAG TPA: hypothetical protein VFT29_19330 [Gemmatimonadaceae bacterium]|nr:hypothetical protein [Gemmatimonadaceae bacterium]
MKKHEAEEKLDRAGEKIHGLSASAWNTALHPTTYGWVRSIASIASIPVLSAASVGHLVTSAVVKQIEPDTFEKMTNLGGKKPET